MRENNNLQIAVTEDHTVGSPLGPISFKEGDVFDAVMILIPAKEGARHSCGIVFAVKHRGLNFKFDATSCRPLIDNAIFADIWVDKPIDNIVKFPDPRWTH